MERSSGSEDRSLDSWQQQEMNNQNLYRKNRKNGHHNYSEEEPPVFKRSGMERQRNYIKSRYDHDL